jgi:hypothetical protein
MNRKIILGIGGALVVVLLAGAAFMAMRLLNTKSTPGNGLEGGPGAGMVTGGKGGGGAMVAIHIEPDPNANLPKQEPDMIGQVATVKDNSFFVSVPSDSAGVQIHRTGDNEPQPTPAGPYNEVVITEKTKIWRDATMDNMQKPGNGSSEQTVQQKLEETDSSIIIANAFVQVWGQKRGDRLIADVMVVVGGGISTGK